VSAWHAPFWPDLDSRSLTLRRWGPRLLLSLCVFWGLLELLLRVLALRLPANIGNEVVRSYSCERGGIYFRDAPTGLQFCYPADHKRVIFNRRAWSHITDSRGFRNPPGTICEVMLLGDSFIYGHGVEEPDTLAANLRNQHGWKAYNMARQGDTLCQEYLLFRLFAPVLKPRRVILFAFGNDFWDLKGNHQPRDLLDPPELHPGYVEALARRLDDPHQRQIEGSWLSSLYSIRSLEVLRRLWQRPTSQGPSPAQEAEDFSQASHYYRRVFEDMARRCRADGIDFRVVFVEVFTDNPHWLRTQEQLANFVRELSTRSQVPYLSTRDLLRGHPEYILPEDGHLSPAGHKALADFLAERLQP